MFGWEWKSGMKKVSLYKFTYVPLLKNDAQLKQNNEKKGNHPNLLKKGKSCLERKKVKKNHV